MMPDGTAVFDQSTNTVSDAAFAVVHRNTRDAALTAPKLTLPSLQVNMPAGHMPEPQDDGRTYLKLPVNGL